MAQEMADHHSLTKPIELARALTSEWRFSGNSSTGGGGSGDDNNMM